MKFVITGYKGFETLLFHEIRSILSEQDCQIEKQYGNITVTGDLKAGYLVILHSRLANRVFLPLLKFSLNKEDDLYQAVREYEWDQCFDSNKTIAINASLSKAVLTHSHYAALKVKDAIVDYFRDKDGSRPDVDTQNPSIRLQLFARKQTAELSLDLSGESLHRRGYRLEHSGAPLKEHLAAGLLMQAKWHQVEYDHLIDPMCGSGTIAIEAAMIKAGMAPAIHRKKFGFQAWNGHDETMWQEVLQQAKASINLKNIAKIYAYDKDHRAVSIARQNAERAGVSDLIDIKVKSLYQLETNSLNNLILFNPPYDERLKAEEGLANLYSQMGKILRSFSNSQVYVFSGNPDLLHRLRMPRISKKALKNGPLNCVLAHFSPNMESAIANKGSQDNVVLQQEINHDAEPLWNRIVKNQKHLKKWKQQNQVSCYRIYDADIPEFAFALDYYQSALDQNFFWLHLQEYQAPAKIPQQTTEKRLKLAIKTIQAGFQIPQDRLIVKVRKKQKGKEQYEKQAEQGEFHQVEESGAQLLVNFTDYLDTGLFLDHRLTRQWIMQRVSGKTVLNLFCYTASVSVMAALGGAKEIISVDMSHTYLKWAQENFAVNGLLPNDKYQFVRANCVDLLQQPYKYDLKRSFDFIFLDPPSFSNSKKMQSAFDIQRDHEQLIRNAMKLLNKDGILLFSNNKKGFKIDTQLEDHFSIRDITSQTISDDYKRRPKIHQCWIIEWKSQ